MKIFAKQQFMGDWEEPGEKCKCKYLRLISVYYNFICSDATEIALRLQPVLQVIKSMENAFKFLSLSKER